MHIIKIITMFFNIILKIVLNKTFSIFKFNMTKFYCINNAQSAIKNMHYKYITFMKIYFTLIN